MKNVDNTENTQSILSLCPGILGLEKGVERAIGKLDIIAYVEIESFIIANLVAQMESGLLAPCPIWTNVKTFDARPFCNKIHGIIGGYPCQPFSHAGERQGSEDERHLWPYISKIINTVRPFWCWFENVAGHLSLGFDEVYRSLRDMGYTVEAGIFTAEEVGATHERERLFILAVANTPNARQQISGLARVGELPKKDFEGMDNRFKFSRDTVEYPPSKFSGRLPIGTETEVARYTLSGQGVANTSSARNASGIPDARQRQERFTGEFNHGGDEHRFPAGQGTYQHPWEEPRTIESSVVYTIDGYNFTEDLHRAIGNSVVEQTAELAFLTLLKKHLKNHERD